MSFEDYTRYGSRSANPDVIKYAVQGDKTRRLTLTLGANVCSQNGFAPGDTVNLLWGRDNDEGKAMLVKVDGKGIKLKASGASSMVYTTQRVPPYVNDVEQVEADLISNKDGELLIAIPVAEPVQAAA